MAAQSNITFVSSFADPFRVRAWCKQSLLKWNFIFLSDDYLQLLRWKEGLGKDIKFISLSSEIEYTTNQLRRPYLSWIAELGKRAPEPAWWASRVSERNTMVSSLFDNVCKLIIVEEYLKKSLSNTIVVVGDFSLLSQLQHINWVGSKVSELPFFTKMPRGINRSLMKSALVFPIVAIPMLFVYRLVQLIWQAIQARLAGSAELRISPDKSILVHTYLEESAFLDSKDFEDRYFPGLERFYNSAGYEVVVLPVMFNIKRGYYKAWSWVRNSKTLFLNPFAFYGISDYVYAVWVAFRTLRLPLGPLVFNGKDVGGLVKGETVRSAFDSLVQVLYLRLPKRMEENGVKVKAMVAEFENMIPEKMLVSGFRTHQPNTFLIGFQHGALYPNFLCNFTPLEERSISPMFDRIVCNGPLFREILISEGLRPDLATVGAALRYRHIANESISTPKSYSDSDKTFDVFVPLPLMHSAGVELLSKVIEAFGKSGEVKSVLLKAHPMSSVQTLLGLLGIDRLPPNFQSTSAPLGEVLPSSKVVIGLSTCSMFEAAAAGVPIIRVRRETALDLDPLGFFSELPPPVCTVEEILIEVQRLLTQDFRERRDLLCLYRKVLKESFHPCDQIGYKAFLPEKK